MTTKAKMVKATETAVTSAAGNTPPAAQPDYKSIPWKDLEISPTNPRRRIDETTIESLAASIKTQGILEPLIVREKGKKYEIVCGERRYRAAQVAALSELPCLVRRLSDEQVLDIQIHENLHREDVHPMDEAYGYQFLKETLACDVKELALRVGKSEGYVLNRLKLNQLIKEAQKDVEDGLLPLVFALEIAKYTPDIQKVVYGEVYAKEYKYQGNNYVSVPIKGQTVPWKSFVEWINTNVHRLLSKAPFDPKATNLLPDGLACVNCPERTGAAVGLFEAKQVGKKDACLNPACFLTKAKNHVEVRRRELAELSRIDPSEVPLVRSFCYTNGKDYLGTESALVIDGANRGGIKKKCKNAVSGIDVEPDNYGQTVQVCLKNSKCKIHWPDRKVSDKAGASGGKSAEEETAEHLETHRVRREEIWNAKVAEAVRVRVLKQAAEKFEKKFRITDVGADLLPQLIARFWRMTVSGDSNNLNGVVKTLVTDWLGDAAKQNGIHLTDGRTATEYVKKLKREMQYGILFVLIHCHKGTIGYSNSYSSQKEVRDLATEFAVDYALIDAEVRLEFSAKKHKEVHETYLAAVRDKDKKAKVPWLFSEKWKATD
jgi:ParB family transcriptional regulator, chromosome partitioning protein